MTWMHRLEYVHYMLATSIGQFHACIKWFCVDSVCRACTRSQYLKTSSRASCSVRSVKRSPHHDMPKQVVVHTAAVLQPACAIPQRILA